MNKKNRFDENVPPVGKGSNKAFGFVRAANLTLRPAEWLIRDYLELDALGVIFGPPGVGKSFMCLDWACCVATGTAYAGCEVRQGPVLYIAGEGQNGLVRRLRAWSLRKRVSLDDAPLHVSTGPASLCDAKAMSRVYDAVNEVADAEGQAPRLLVFDTLARNFGPGDENATTDMNRAIGALDKFRGYHRPTVLVVHHSGHGDPHRMRGNSALRGALDAEYLLKSDESDSTLLWVTNNKMKDAPKPRPFAVALRSVELDVHDADGRPVTSAVLELLDPQPATPPVSRGESRRRTSASRASMSADAGGRRRRSVLNV